MQVATWMTWFGRTGRSSAALWAREAAKVGRYLVGSVPAGNGASSPVWAALVSGGSRQQYSYTVLLTRCYYVVANACTE